MLNLKHAGSKSTAGLFILLNRKNTGSKSTAWLFILGLFVLLNHKHARSIWTAGLFILLNRKHAGNKSTAEPKINDKKLKSCKQGSRNNATKFAIVRNS